MDLTTHYLGITLPHPFIVGASPLTEDLGIVSRLEDAGAAAIVMHSLFEEDIVGHGIEPHEYLEQLLRIKGASRIALTTDQTSAAGAPPGSYSLSGRAVHSDGRVVRLEDGTLAGSAAAMPDLVRLMARLPGMTPARAVSLASAAPARVLGERLLGRIGEGACADIVILDAELRPRLTMIRGAVIFRRPD